MMHLGDKKTPRRREMLSDGFRLRCRESGKEKKKKQKERVIDSEIKEE